ncbi:MAG: signal peptidase I [Bacteroidales bacterium]|nr:signal peptidase I [Bacteroidales bacterium]
MGWKEFTRNKWTKFIFWALLYTLWVIWLGNYWWLFGLVIVFDLIVTKKVHWLFWQKRYKEGEKHNAALDWLDAIIFAAIVVTFINIFFFQAFKIPSSSMEKTLYTGDHLFVGKLTYGPRVPQTPLTIPFTHNVIFGRESYSKAIQNDYRRLKGFRGVNRGDIVVFGFPNGDTVLKKAPVEDYYMLCRELGKDKVIDRLGPVIVRPADKKDHYVKRCVAVAGDTLEIRDGLVYIDGQMQKVWEGVQYSYRVTTSSGKINSRILDEMGMNVGELYYDAAMPGYSAMPLTYGQLEKVRSMSNVVSAEANIDVYPPDYPDSPRTLFPFEDKGWTRDNYGPLWVPCKGATVKLDADNLAIYRRIIEVYEHNTLEQTAQGFRINGELTDSYTFKQDYYFMMGDNRHNSLDSRYWGFVPEDHVVGRPAIIWLSTDRDRKFPANIRWRRFLRIV